MYAHHDIKYGDCFSRRRDDGGEFNALPRRPTFVHVIVMLSARAADELCVADGLNCMCSIR